MEMILGGLFLIGSFVCIGAMWAICMYSTLKDSAEEWANDYIDSEIERLIETAEVETHIEIVWYEG